MIKLREIFNKKDVISQGALIHKRKRKYKIKILIILIVFFIIYIISNINFDKKIDNNEIIIKNAVEVKTITLKKLPPIKKEVKKENTTKQNQIKEIEPLDAL